MKKIRLEGVIGWDITSAWLDHKLAAAKGEGITLEINSPGGFVYEGLKIFNSIKNYSGRVDTHLMGLAASMGSYIALAGSGRLTAEANNVYMIHNVWGVGVGDYREMKKSADVFEGLTGLLANAYSERTGKPVEEIRAMMDDETYLFGQEAVDAGFIDEITDGNPGDKLAVLASAQLTVVDCLAKVRTSETEKQDAVLDKVAALIVPSIPRGDTPAEKPAGKQQQEVVTMNLSEFLAQNPAEKVQFDSDIATAKKAGADEVQARVDKAVPILGSKDYPAEIKAVALSVVQGDETTATLTTTVAVYDSLKEKVKSGEAKGESGEETPAVSPDAPVAEDGTVSTEEEHRAAIARIKNISGQGD